MPIVLTGGIYLRGWLVLSRGMPQRFDARRAVAFMSGLAAVLVALGPPLDTLSHELLQAHMAQHLLLMMVAAPLLWLGAPVAPLLRGLPRAFRRTVAVTLSRPGIRRLTRRLAHPAVGWVAFNLAFWVWHAPVLYEVALRSDHWHHVQHACFFVTALLFWRPVILAWPARPVWPRWAMIPYVLLAQFQNTILAVILTFADRVIYSGYETLPGPRGLSPLEDQSLAGVIMWVPGSLAFLLPLLWLLGELLAPPLGRGARSPRY